MKPVAPVSATRRRRSRGEPARGRGAANAPRAATATQACCRRPERGELRPQGWPGERRGGERREREVQREDMAARPHRTEKPLAGRLLVEVRCGAPPRPARGAQAAGPA